jgi:hypothetical protein
VKPRPSSFTTLGFIAKDGTLIKPFYDDSGNLAGAAGRDSNGVNRKIEFSTNVDSQWIPFHNAPVEFCSAGAVISGGTSTRVCFPGNPPPGCDNFGCNVYKTTTYITYSEEFLPRFRFTIVVDPMNYESQVRVNELVRSGSEPGSGVTELLYVMRMDGTGEEHVTSLGGNVSRTAFTFNRHDGTLSINPNFDQVFPELQRVDYFQQVLNYVLLRAPIISGGEVAYDTSGNLIWNWRYVGDAVIAGAAILVCTSTAGLGCLLAGAVAAAGTDYWQSINPGVVNANGRSTADDIVLFWLAGGCNSIGEIWTLITGSDPFNCQF